MRTHSISAGFLHNFGKPAHVSNGKNLRHCASFCFFQIGTVIGAHRCFEAHVVVGLHRLEHVCWSIIMHDFGISRDRAFHIPEVGKKDFDTLAKVTDSSRYVVPHFSKSPLAEIDPNFVRRRHDIEKSVKCLGTPQWSSESLCW